MTTTTTPFNSRLASALQSIASTIELTIELAHDPTQRDDNVRIMRAWHLDALRACQNSLMKLTELLKDLDKQDGERNV